MESWFSKMIKIPWLAALLLAAALQGCSRTSPAPDPPKAPAEEASAVQEASSPEQADPQKRYPCDEYTWAADGTLLVQKDDAVTWVDTDNTPAHTARFPLPEGYIGQRLTIGQRYVFAAYFLDPDETQSVPLPVTRVTHGDEGYSLVNCALFDLDGTLVHAFPAADDGELREDYLPFEKRYRFCNFDQVHWLDETHFVVDDTARVFVYSLDTGELVLAADYTADKAQGFTVGDSNAYGTGMGHVDTGRYYFTASGFADTIPGQPPTPHFYAMDPLGAVSELTPDPRATLMRANNGVVGFYANWSDAEGNLGLDAWYQSADGGEIRNGGRYGEGRFLSLIHGTGCVSCEESSFTTEQTGPDTWRSELDFLNFRTVEPRTGAEWTFDPRSYDYGPDNPLPEAYTYALLGARTGGIFLYALNWNEDTSAGETTLHSRVYVYSAESGEARLLAETAGSTLSANPQATAVAEQDQNGSVRVIPAVP